MNVSGTINANQMNINVINKNVINLSASGDTKFGDTSDDTHQFTGSILVNGSIIRERKSITSSPYSISATDYIIGVDTATIEQPVQLICPWQTHYKTDNPLL